MNVWQFLNIESLKNECTESFAIKSDFIQEYSVENTQLDFNCSFNNTKKGDLVRIIKRENSMHNYYKNYIGEIKERSINFCKIHLIGCNSNIFIYLPYDHFCKAV